MSGMFRSSARRYTSRPPANCRAARAAWDGFASEGRIVWLHLVDGHWGAMREDGSISERENLPLQKRSKSDRLSQKQIVEPTDSSVFLAVKLCIEILHDMNRAGQQSPNIHSDISKAREILLGSALFGESKS